MSFQDVGRKRPPARSGLNSAPSSNGTGGDGAGGNNAGYERLSETIVQYQVSSAAYLFQ